jgi:hypothetical protein
MDMSREGQKWCDIHLRTDLNGDVAALIDAYCGSVAFRWRARAMGVFKTIGISRPEALLGFGVCAVELLPAVFRTKVVCAFVIPGRQLDLAGIDGFAADGVHRSFRGC